MKLAHGPLKRRILYARKILQANMYELCVYKVIHEVLMNTNYVIHLAPKRSTYFEIWGIVDEIEP